MMQSEQIDVNSHPLVSVVLLTCRRDHYLKEALASALNQTYRSIEAIVSDDVDSPATRALVEGFEDNRVRYRSNRPGLGQLGNQVAALREAKGEFAAILHDDDIWEPNFLATLVPLMIGHPEIVLSFCDHWIMDVDGVIDQAKTDVNTRHYGRDKLASGVYQPFPEFILRMTIPMVMGTVFRRAALPLDELPDWVGAAVDFWTAFLLCRTGGAAIYMPKRLVRYRVHMATVSGERHPTWAFGTGGCFEAAQKSAIFGAYVRKLRLLAADQYRHAAAGWLRRGERIHARHAASCALRNRWTFKNVAAYALTFAPNSVGARL